MKLFIDFPIRKMQRFPSALQHMIFPRFSFQRMLACYLTQANCGKILFYVCWKCLLVLVFFQEIKNVCGSVVKEESCEFFDATFDILITLSVVFFSFMLRTLCHCSTHTNAQYTLWRKTRLHHRILALF